MRSKKQKRLTKKLLWLEVHPDTVSRDELLAEDHARAPEDAHRDIDSSGVTPLAPREEGFVCPCK